MYTVYVLKSIETDRSYVGYTQELHSRLKEHNSGRVRSTKAYKPYRIVYTEEFSEKTEARKREIYFKTGPGRQWLKEQSFWKDGRVV